MDICTGRIILLAYLANKWIIQPKKMMNLLAKRFRDKGYKVKVFPYSPLGSPELERIHEDAKEKGDAFYEDKN